MSYDVSGEEFAGEDGVMGVDPGIMGDAEVLGAISNAIARRARSPVAGRPRVFRRPPLAAVPGQPDAKLRSFVGLGTVLWTGAADAGDKSVTIEPQESFRGERLVISLVTTGGADAGLTMVRRIDVGTQPQSPSVEQPAPASMFSPDATYAGLDLQVAHRGMKLQVTLARTASPGAGVTTTAAVGFYGEWIR